MDTNTSTQFSTSIRNNGLRMTRQRALILDILHNSQEHLDADALHDFAKKQDPQIGLATVYRTLALLKEFGLVEQYSLGEEHGHFETTPENPHHHFTCLKCKRVIEFQVPCIESFVDNVRETNAVEITKINLSFEGYCPNCQENTEA